MQRTKNTNVTLIGMPGVGKSVIGRELAQRMGYAFIDTDVTIEKRAGLKLQQILDTFGEEKFMKLEEQAALDIGKTDKCIISPGGSIIYSERAMKFLAENSRIVFLKMSFSGIRKRLANMDTRGIVGLKKKGLKALFDERSVLYERCADIKIELSDKDDLDTVVKTVIGEAFGR
ncbi:shikimate kinase [Candidatus Poribacteria bacterium]|nr:shikimate kinase [Candidatus Poribacteria bacterium]